MVRQPCLVGLLNLIGHTGNIFQKSNNLHTLTGRKLFKLVHQSLKLERLLGPHVIKPPSASVQGRIALTRGAPTQEDPPKGSAYKHGNEVFRFQVLHPTWGMTV